MIVRNLLAELAERIDVRVLSWKGAPLPVFKPSQEDVREMLDALARHTKIEAHADGCTGFTHCHHEKTIVVDGRVAFVGGIDLTLDGGDPWDTPSHVARGGIGWHDAAVRLEGPVVADVARSFQLRWHGATREELPAPDGARGGRRRRGADREDAARRARTAPCGTATTRSSSPTSARSGRRSGSSTSRTSSSGRRRSSRSSPTSCATRPATTSGCSCSCLRARTTAPTSRAARWQRSSMRPTRRPDSSRAPIYARGREASRSRVHPLEDRDRRRSLAHGRLGEPQRALPLPRHRDERRHARSRDRSRDAAPSVVRSTWSCRSRTCRATRSS